MEAKGKDIASLPEIRKGLFIEAHKLLITHKLRALEMAEPLSSLTRGLHFFSPLLSISLTYSSRSHKLMEQKLLELLFRLSRENSRYMRNET